MNTIRMGIENGTLKKAEEEGNIARMNTLLYTITKASGARNRPKLCLMGAWLPEMGFVPDALVMAIPEKDGFTFTLCDENIRKYSELAKVTKEQNGKLMSVILLFEKGKPCPTLITTGEYIRKGGLEIGSQVVICYEYGKIRLRKLDLARLGFAEPTKVSLVGKSKSKQAHRSMPCVRLNGEVLTENGFKKDVLATVCFEPDSLTIQLQDEGIQKYSSLVKYAREHKMKLLQISEISGRNQKIPHIHLSGSCLERAGFLIGELFAIHAEYGILQCKKIALEQVGF